MSFANGNGDDPGQSQTNRDKQGLPPRQTNAWTLQLGVPAEADAA